MTQPYRSPLLDLPGAVEAAAPDTGVAAHYGDPFREQRRLVGGVGAVDLSHRDVVRVSGPDRLTWLHQLTSQHLEHLAPYAATSALLLDANGRVEHALYGVDDGSAIWFHLEPGAAATLVEFLEKMKFWSDVKIADVTGDYAMVWSPVTKPDSTHLSRVTARGRDVLVRRSELLAYVEAAGEPAGIWAYEALRIEAH
ncbi:MAG: YgfZ/GcvT domain-containing protein, partial [Jiangellaceae bacterium]